MIASIQQSRVSSIAWAWAKPYKLNSRAALGYGCAEYKRVFTHPDLKDWFSSEPKLFSSRVYMKRVGKSARFAKVLQVLLFKSHRHG